MSEIKRYAKKAGMRVAGNFLVVTQTEDVVSGIAIDSAPSITYLWAFVLPTYDKLIYLHMTLGERIGTWEKRESCDQKVSAALEIYSSKLENVRSANDLLSYVSCRGLSSDYANWVKFLSYIRIADFLSAERQMNELMLVASSMSEAAKLKMEVLKNAVTNGGWPAAQNVLQEWALSTRKLLET